MPEPTETPKPLPQIWGVIDDDWNLWQLVFASERDAKEAIEIIRPGDGDRPVRLVPAGSDGPQWREKPTCPGRWLSSDGRSVWLIADAEAVPMAFGGSWYGPIPECDLDTKASE